VISLCQGAFGLAGGGGCGWSRPRRRRARRHGPSPSARWPNCGFGLLLLFPDPLA
jgi:hypothetical protein